MILWMKISGVILLAFTMWYWFWKKEQALIAIEEIVKELVKIHKLKYPDEDIKNLRINVRFKGEQLEEEEEN